VVYWFVPHIQEHDGNELRQSIPQHAWVLSWVHALYEVRHVSKHIRPLRQGTDVVVVKSGPQLHVHVGTNEEHDAPQQPWVCPVIQSP
jgi:hypothetical protein